MRKSGAVRRPAFIAVCVIVAAVGISLLIVNYPPDGQATVGFTRVFFAVFGLLSYPLLVMAVALNLLPEDARDIDWSEPIVFWFVSVALMLAASAKRITPLLSPYFPFGDLSKHIMFFSVVLISVAAPRKLNARLARVASRHPSWCDKDDLAILAFCGTQVLCVSIASVLTGVTRSTISIAGIKIEVASTDPIVIIPIVVAVVALAFWFVSRDKTFDDQSAGRVVEGTRSGHPLLAWSQITATGETAARSDTRRRFRIYFGVIVAAALAGLASGSTENALFYAMAAAWLGALGLRGAGNFAMRGETLAHVPHVKTDEERREELTPMTRREDCEAFVEEVDGTLWFCVARGTASEGQLPVVERVPFDSFGNFEEGSHKQWFRPRGSVNETLDWGVIVAQSSVGRIVLVAQSLGEQAWLIELLVKLQTTFIGPRDAMLRALKEAEQKRRAHDAPAGRPGASSDDAPIRPF